MWHRNRMYSSINELLPKSTGSRVTSGSVKCVGLDHKKCHPSCSLEFDVENVSNRRAKSTGRSKTRAGNMLTFLMIWIRFPMRINSRPLRDAADGEQVTETIPLWDSRDLMHDHMHISQRLCIEID